MSRPTGRDFSSFGVSLISVVSGLAVSLWAVRDVQTSALGMIAAFTVAYGLVDAMSVKLARGDHIFIDGAVSLSAVVALSPGAAIVSCLVGTILGAVFNIGVQRTLVSRLGEILRRPLLVAGLALAASRFLDVTALSRGASGPLLVCAALGGLYAVADFCLLVGVVALDTKASVRRTTRALGRSLVGLYAAHVSLGVATALLIGQVGTWGLWAMVALVLLSQYSFNLLLRTRRAYSETIQALMRASELRVDESVQGHALRVADIAVGAGRLLGLSSEALERLNYAALLHEIGRIGMGDDSSLGAMVEDHALRGAAIVGEIPFLASTARMIAKQRDFDGPEVEGDAELAFARIIGACCDLDRAVVARPMRWDGGTDVESLGRCLPEDGIEATVRSAILHAASDVAGS